MADIAAVLGRLTQDELNELRSLGPSGHLTRRLTDAIDRAAGGPGAGRGYYVPNGSVSSTGGPHRGPAQRRFGLAVRAGPAGLTGPRRAPPCALDTPDSFQPGPGRAILAQREGAWIADSDGGG